MQISQDFFQFLKDIPLVDFGTNRVRHTTQGKIIACRYAKAFAGIGKTALDVGCGDGFWSEKLSMFGYEVTSIDLNVSYKKARMVNLEKSLPFSDGSFDLVWSTEVLEHLYSPETLVREIKRILKPHGRMVLTTPNSYFWIYPIFKLFGYTPKDIQNADHKQFFSIKAIRALFPRARILGFFPYTILKFTIKNPTTLHYLSPTFVMVSTKEDLPA